MKVRNKVQIIFDTNPAVAT